MRNKHHRHGSHRTRQWLYLTFIDILTWITSYGILVMCEEILKTILEEVTALDLSDGDVAWRKIMYKANMVRSLNEPF